MNIGLPKKVNTVMEILFRKGYKAFVVGGSIRDSLLGLSPKDWDISTDATPEETKACFENLPGFSVVETGLKHGTVTVIVEHEAFEITTFRIEGEYSDFRRPDKVSFSRDIKEDLKRRDFTINAMAYNSKSGLIDLFGGCGDLENKIIRCVGSADKRFEEDALRIIRCLRFSSQLGFCIEEETLRGATKKRELLNRIAIERIREEFIKLLTGSMAGDVLREYREIIAVFIPEIESAFECDQQNDYHIYDVWEHTVHTVENIPCPFEEMGCEGYGKVLRLAAFFHDIGKPRCKTVTAEGWGHFYGHEKESTAITAKIMSRMKFDNRTKALVTESIANHGIVFNPYGKQPRRLLGKLGEEKIRLLIELEKADVKSQAPKFIDERIENIRVFEAKVNTLIEEDGCFSIKDLAVTGNDLIEIGIPQGKEIGNILNSLLEKVIDGELNNEKEALLDQISEWKKIPLTFYGKKC